MMYQARILDKDKNVKAVLPGVRWAYDRSINAATGITVEIPTEIVEQHITQADPLYAFLSSAQPAMAAPVEVRGKPSKAKYAEIASYIQIYKGEQLKVSGKITGRVLGPSVTIEAFTEEILLESNLTPAQYGKVWDDWDLADVARDLLEGWRIIRVKAQEQWQSHMVDSQNIDLTTDPGHVMLAKKSSGQYHESGYITLFFDASEVPNFTRWDRIRWTADSEDPVKTTIQHSNNGVSWSAEWDGGLPDEVGLVPSTATSTQLYVRLNLYTDDVETEGSDEQPVGVTPYIFACEAVARTEPVLAEGSIPTMAGVTVKGLSADYDNTLSVLVEACEQAAWEFNVWNGALNLAKSLGTDWTSDFVFRAGTNIEIVSLGDDDGELCNVLTAYGPGSGLNRMEITLKDEASISEYGEYPKAVEFEAKTLAELEQKAQEYLDEHNTPVTSFEIAVVFDYDKEPDYALGDVVRVADPETGIVTTTRIMAERREYAENGLNVHLELGKPSFTLQSVLEGDPRPRRPLEPVQPLGIYASSIVAGIRVGFAEPKIDKWSYTEVHVSTASNFEPSSGTLRDKGRQTKFDILGLEPGMRYYVRVVHVDENGRKSPPGTEVSAIAGYMQPEALPDHSIGAEKFLDSLQVPRMVTSKPNFPDPRYPANTILFYTVDGKLYRSTGTNWEPMVAADFADLTGKITRTQIDDGAIRTPHLYTNAVTADKLNTNEATVNKITAGIGQFGGIVTDNVLVSSGDGQTFFDGSSIVTSDNHGGQSELTAGRLIFRKEVGTDEVTSHYLSRIEVNEASDGQRVPLNFDSPPKVIVTPSTLLIPPFQQIYDPNDMPVHYHPVIDARAIDISSDGFTVVCRTYGRMIEGGQNIGQTIAEGQSYTSGYSSETTEIKVGLRINFSAILYRESGGYGQVKYRVQHQRRGGSWVTVGNYTYGDWIIRGWLVFSSGKRIGKSLSTSHAFEVPTGEHRIRITLTSATFAPYHTPPYSAPHSFQSQIRVNDWQYITRDVLSTGDAYFIAIEGGE